MTYESVRQVFLSKPENKFCRLFPGNLATEVHHKKGRVGYADDWARRNGIPLLIDVRYFLPVSREGHNKIENNPEWAKALGYSHDRLEIINN